MKAKHMTVILTLTEAYQLNRIINDEIHLEKVKDFGTERRALLRAQDKIRDGINRTEGLKP